MSKVSLTSMAPQLRRARTAATALPLALASAAALAHSACSPAEIKVAVSMLKAGTCYSQVGRPAPADSCETGVEYVLTNVATGEIAKDGSLTSAYTSGDAVGGAFDIPLNVSVRMTLLCFGADGALKAKGISAPFQVTEEDTEGETAVSVVMAPVNGFGPLLDGTAQGENPTACASLEWPGTNTGKPGADPACDAGGPSSGRYGMSVTAFTDPSSNSEVVLLAGGFDVPPSAAGGAALSDTFYDRETPTAEAFLYDPAVGRFCKVGSLARARGFHTATALSNGRVVVAGGVGLVDGSPALRRTLREVEVFSVDQKTFAANATSLSEGRAGHTATYFERTVQFPAPAGATPTGWIIFAGGFTFDQSQAAVGAFRVLGTLDIMESASTRIEPLKSPEIALTQTRAWHTATAVPGRAGTIVFVGGRSITDNAGTITHRVVGETEVFQAGPNLGAPTTIAAGNFSLSAQIASIPSPRWGHAAIAVPASAPGENNNTLIQQAAIVVVGGYTTIAASGAENTAETYNTATQGVEILSFAKTRWLPGCTPLAAGVGRPIAQRLVDGSILIVGGRGTTGLSSNATQILRLNTTGLAAASQCAQVAQFATLKPESAMLNERMLGAAASLAGGEQVLIAGGIGCGTGNVPNPAQCAGVLQPELFVASNPKVDQASSSATAAQ